MAKVWYGHFDSAINDKRTLLAEDWAKYIRTFITDGIRNGGTCLQVTNKTGMSINIDEGIANIQGYIFISERDGKGRYMELELEDSHNQYNRIDRVVLKLDRNAQKRTIEPIILRGTASSNPVPPALTRNNLVYEISLAKIFVKANTLVIKQEDITDERFNGEVCGLINSILGLDSSEWQRMFDEFMAGLKEANDNELNRIKEELEQIFSNQMTEQENEFNTKKSEIQSWYDDIKNNINIIKDFDFDNLVNLNNVVRETTKNSSQITEIIKFEPNQKNIAKRTTTINKNEIIINLIVYEEDGETEKLNKNIVTTIIDGKIIERVD